MEENDDGALACFEARKRGIEPRELRVRKSWFDAAVTIFGVENHETREFQFDRVVERSKHRAVLLSERTIACVTLAAHEVVIARRWIEGHLQRADDVEECLSLAAHMLVIARVTLHEIADREDGIGARAVEVFDRLTQVAEAPIATRRAVGDDRDDLSLRSRGLCHDLPIDRVAGVVLREGWGSRRGIGRRSRSAGEVCGRGKNRAGSEECGQTLHFESVADASESRVLCVWFLFSKNVWRVASLRRTRVPSGGFSF